MAKKTRGQLNREGKEKLFRTKNKQREKQLLMLPSCLVTPTTDKESCTKYMHNSKHFTYSNLFNPQNDPVRQNYYYPASL